MVISAQSWRIVGDLFSQWMKEQGDDNTKIHIIAHNMFFDRGRITQEVQPTGENNQYSIQLPSNIQWHCSIQVVKELFPDITVGGLDDLCKM